ncbi:hypothetical protein [Desulfosporosinus sp. OT]|uniref:hypothetical protein n=1 Tax=Desulfosporosinus sp. OT TaxID=913865 RepID=UPI000223ADB4|nr:hypothetical protein [Desulfosporosinus sp. OT]EGW38985.1 hypothetical protein DOT_3160 [Desulfosporosinus sp. OT]
MIPDVSKLKVKKDGIHTTVIEINEASISDGSPPSSKAVFPMDLPTISEGYVLDGLANHQRGYVFR